MIPSSNLMKLVILAIAVSVHGVLAYAFYKPPDIKISGSTGGTGATAQLGFAFADLISGTISPLESQEAALQPVQAEAVSETQPIDATKPRPTPKAATTTEAVPAPYASPQEISAPQVLSVAAAVQPTVQASAQTAEPVQKLLTQDLVKAIEEPVKPAKKKPVEKPKPKPKPQMVTATKQVSEPVEKMVTQEVAKVIEDPVKPTKKKPVKKPKPKPKPQKLKAGNAQTDSAAGQENGVQKSQSKTKGNTQPAAKVGNAAKSNYSGKVVRKIKRAKFPKASRPYVTGVLIVISANGQLGSISVTKSSGSRDFDNAVVRAVKRAAPFPKPPAGKFSFSVRLK